MGEYNFTTNTKSKIFITHFKKIKMRILNPISVLVFVIVSIGCINENKYKYILIDKMHYTFILTENIVILENLDGYYGEVSFTLTDDSSYVMVLWGDRESLWWNIRKDKVILVDVPYDRYKGRNVDLDVELISEFNENIKVRK